MDVNTLSGMQDVAYEDIAGAYVEVENIETGEGRAGVVCGRHYGWVIRHYSSSVRPEFVNPLIVISTSDGTLLEISDRDYELRFFDSDPESDITGFRQSDWTGDS